MAWSDAVGAMGSAFINLGGSLIKSNQDIKNAQFQANAQLQALDKQYQIALTNQQTIAMQNQQNKPKVEGDGKNNIPLYIGLGVGGILVLGIVIYAIKK